MISPAECLLIASALFILLYISTPVLSLNKYHPPYDNFLLAAWLGRVSLSWVFWPFFVFLNVSLLLVDVLARTAHMTVSSWDEIHFVLLLTIVWWIVSIWRCSENTQTRLWAALARLTTFAILVEYGLKLWIRIDYPRIFFNCEETLLDYVSCF
jgi:hypothetical protein